MILTFVLPIFTLFLIIIHFLTKLSFLFLFLTGWNFPIGSQVYENYGQPNHIYFTYHGFSLNEPLYEHQNQLKTELKIKGNSQDCVYFEFYLSLKEIDNISWDASNVRAIVQVRSYRI